MKKRKKHQEEEHENLERWLVSYADFITLLFAFFVTMYAISRVDEKKLGSVVESLHRALGSTIFTQSSPPEPGVFQTSSHPLDVSIIPTPREKGVSTEDFEKLAQNIQKKMAERMGNNGTHGEASLNELKFIIDKRGLVLRFSERFFFDSGDASIRPEVVPLLTVLAQSLEDRRPHGQCSHPHRQIPLELGAFHRPGHLDRAPLPHPPSIRTQPALRCRIRRVPPHR
jgi:chemotaxis protein MotB